MLCILFYRGVLGYTDENNEKISTQCYRKEFIAGAFSEGFTMVWYLILAANFFKIQLNLFVYHLCQWFLNHSLGTAIFLFYYQERHFQEEQQKRSNA